MLRDLEELRKDPEMVFHYNLARFRSAQPQPDEPTQKMDSAESQGHRQRVRTWSPSGSDEDGDYEDEETGRSRLLVPVVVVVCLVAAAVGLWLAFFSGMFDKAEMVEVPQLLGRTLTEVYEDPAVTDNFQVNRVSTEFSDEYKEGEIISQDPPYGQSAEKGTTINVVVSGGQEYLDMIDVTDMSYEKAAAQLEGMGLIVEEPEYEYSEDVAEGNVISSSPEAGSPILPGDSVHLVVSQGEEVKMVRVPNVTGQSLESARVTLTSQGLTISGITEVTNEHEQGQVIYQSIAPNTEVEEGTALTLQVSKGPEKAPEVQMVVVPTVTGQKLDTARTLLLDAELQIGSIAEVDSDAPVGQVVYQSIPAGTSVEEGTSVSLQVSKGPVQPEEEEPEEPEL
jgi:serine/threonine-protein kinase